MKKLFSLAALALLAACRTTADPEPAPHLSGRDELALATGHWEWDRTLRGFGSNQSPASVGYSRQLVFGADGQVQIAHDGRVVKTTAYQLSMGEVAGCGPGPQTPIIQFENEEGIQGSVRKAYQVQPTTAGQTLRLTGDYACVDGGAYESFHWVAD